MARIGTAFRAFFGSLFNGETASRVAAALHGDVLPAPAEKEGQKASAPVVTPQQQPDPPKPLRSDAITVLAALQREARFVDFIKEPLSSLSDEQIGAAVRDIHQNLAAAVERLFEVQPLLGDAEGSAVTVPKGFDAGCYQLTGNVSGEPPFAGTLAHHGWKVGQLNLPKWSGSDAAAEVIAPAEVELK